MKTNTNRIQGKGGKNSVKLQPSIVKSNTPAPKSSVIPVSLNQELLLPSKVALTAQDAFSILNCVGNAAVAFVMMNGYKIKEESQHDHGWEPLDVAGFSDGALELARMISSDFQCVLADLNTFIDKMVELVQYFHAPVQKSESSKGFGLTDSIDPKRSWHHIENKTFALLNCIHLQAWALCCNDDQGGEQHGSYEMASKLEKAYKDFESKFFNLMDVYCTVKIEQDAKEAA